jgi:hypothetical protein
MDHLFLISLPVNAAIPVKINPATAVKMAMITAINPRYCMGKSGRVQVTVQPL